MYLEFYQLKAAPFGVTPDPAYLFLSTTHREALASLYYALESNCGFTALIARPGMGKTTLLFQLMERLREGDRTAFLFQTQCNSREFLTYLLSDLGHPPKDQNLVSMHLQLNELLIRQAAQGRRFVIIVDEAQNLDSEVLETIRLLSDFETPSQKLMQIVLAGQPQLAEKLSQPGMQQLRQRISIVARLSPFSALDTEQYIQYRLQVAGYQGESLFTEEAIALIAQKSRGIPRLINTLCFNALSLGFADQLKVVDGALIRQVLIDLDLSIFLPKTPRPDSTAAKKDPRLIPESTARHAGGRRAGDKCSSEIVPIGASRFDKPNTKAIKIDPTFVGWLQSIQQENAATRRTKQEALGKQPARTVLAELPLKTTTPVVAGSEVSSPLPATEGPRGNDLSQTFSAAKTSGVPYPKDQDGQQCLSGAKVEVWENKAISLPAIDSVSGAQPGEQRHPSLPLNGEEAADKSRVEISMSEDVVTDTSRLVPAGKASGDEDQPEHQNDAISTTPIHTPEVPRFRVPPGPSWRPVLVGTAAAAFLLVMVAFLTQLHFSRSQVSPAKTEGLILATQPTANRVQASLDLSQQTTSQELGLLSAHQPGSTLSDLTNGSQDGQNPLLRESTIGILDSHSTKAAEAVPTETSPPQPSMAEAPVESEVKKSPPVKGAAWVVEPLPEAGTDSVDEVHPKSTQFLTIIVGPKQTLRKICRHYLGRYDLRLQKEIIKLNPQLEDPNYLEVGQHLRIPMPEEHTGD